MRTPLLPAPAAHRLGRAVALALLAGTLLVASACGSGDGDEEGAGTEPPATTTTPPATGTDAAPDRMFTSRRFEPRFTIEIPASWEPVEEAGMVQFFSGETSERALTVSSALARATVQDAVARMRGAPNLDAAAPADATLAGSQGQVFDATVSSGYSTDIPGIDYLIVADFRVRIWALDTGAKTVVLIADAPAAESEAFVAEVEQALGTLRFGPA